MNQLLPYMDIIPTIELFARTDDKISRFQDSRYQDFKISRYRYFKILRTDDDVLTRGADVYVLHLPRQDGCIKEAYTTL